MDKIFKLTIDSEGIAKLVFDIPNSKVNVLSVPAFEQLDVILEDLKKNNHVKALVITSAKEGIFIAGADINIFKGAFKDHTIVNRILDKGHDSLNRMQQLPFPTIAVINGACLGGGTEFALACTYRIVVDSPKTQIGLPEVSLGIYPGWGGTQRLPRLVGFREGVQMIVTGKAVNAMKAWKIKLADAIAAPAFVEEKTSEFVKQCLTPEGKKRILNRRKRKGILNFLLEKNPLGRSLVSYVVKRKIMKQTKGKYPAPLVALNLIKRTYTSSLQSGLKKEVSNFISKMETDLKTAPNLIKIFFINEALKNNPGIPQGAIAKKISAAAVLGAGTMGSGISWLFSNAGIPVRMKDVNWDVIAKGYGSAWNSYQALLRIKKVTHNEANLKFLKIGGTIDFSGFQHVDFVVEAATENIELKQKILNELEKEVRPDCVIATNTSSLSVTALASTLSHPERLVGMHFFNPPSRMPLVEVIRGDKTSPEAVATAVDTAKKLKKTPIVVKDCAGFLVNRILIAGMAEAFYMFEEGTPMGDIEKAVLDFGMPMGPFTLSDEVGNDVGYKIGKIFEEAYGARMKSSKLLEKMNEHKLLGKKSGKGFYIYGEKTTEPNPEIETLISRSSKNRLSKQEITDRFVLAMINEATRCLEEKVVSSPENLDMALVLGTGFPPFRGGLLNYADESGITNLVEKMKALEKIHGIRFTPSNLLLEMQKANKQFY